MAKTRVYNSEQQSHIGQAADKFWYADERQNEKEAQLGETLVTPGILKHFTIKRNTCDSHGKYLMKMAFIFIVVDP